MVVACDLGLATSRGYIGVLISCTPEATYEIEVVYASLYDKKLLD